MRKYLVFRIRAPFSSWGDIAVGGHRPSYDHPSKSAIMGLLGAGIGLDRDETDCVELSKRLNFAVLVNAPGTLLRDFHTTQMPGEDAIQERNGCGCFVSRREELSVPCDMIETTLSVREYYCNAIYTIGVWEIQ